LDMGKPNFVGRPGPRLLHSDVLDIVRHDNEGEFRRDARAAHCEVCGASLDSDDVSAWGDRGDRPGVSLEERVSDEGDTDGEGDSSAGGGRLGVEADEEFGYAGGGDVGVRVFPDDGFGDSWSRDLSCEEKCAEDDGFEHLLDLS
jgi:hypothetical protein